MPYDEGLAHRVRRTLAGHASIEEREMFGGLAFLLDGRVVVGVIGESLVARVGPDAYDDALDAPHARPFDFTGRPMRGWVFVDPPALAEDDALSAWVERSLAFVGSLGDG